MSCVKAIVFVDAKLRNGRSHPSSNLIINFLRVVGPFVACDVTDVVQLAV